MSSYLLKYKGKYRVRAKYDLNTLIFPREPSKDKAKGKGGKREPRFETLNLYIECESGEIWHYGKSTLFFLSNTPAIGKNVIKRLKKMGKEDIVTKIEYTEAEGLLYFNSKHMDVMAEACRVRIKGANVSPFSSRNLPTSKKQWEKYEPQDKELYREFYDLLKYWIKIQKVSLKNGFALFYKKFGKHVKEDFIELSDKLNYRPLNVIDMKGYTDKGIKWLNKQIAKLEV